MKKFIITILAISITQFAIAQEDEPGCKDHPFFNRLPNFRITSCASNYNALPVRHSLSNTEEKEGNLTTLGYTFSSENENDKLPSPLQVIKNYENAIVKNGGKKIYSTVTEGPQGATFSLAKGGKTYWVTIDNMTPGRTDICDGYELHILEVEEMEQSIVASEMFDKINSSGSIALYINFETGKSDIKKESMPIIEQLVTLLKSNPGLKVSIEGHTDNTGTPAGNKTLSDARAKSVMKAVVAGGIEASRLSAKGWGQEKPVAENSSEDGRSRNRRVEIVKM